MKPITRSYNLYLEDMLTSMLRIDYEMIWEISKNNLPQNSIDLRRIIENGKPV